jgi:hypothetical protein
MCAVFVVILIQNILARRQRIHYHSEMKHIIFGVSAALLLLASVGAKAQIAWGSPETITDASNIATNGVYFDGINSYQNNGGANDFVPTVVGTTTFNALVNVPGMSETTGTDGTITLSSNGGNYRNPYTTGGSASYNYVLSQGSDAINGVITLGSLTHQLTIGDVYQVEAWDSYGGSYTAHIDGNPALNFPAYATTYAIGTFTATASTFTFDYGPAVVTNNSGAGFVNDLVVRDLGAAPEPSTYTMMLAGGIGLLFLLRRRAMTS